jgi:hypothetical protein
MSARETGDLPPVTPHKQAMKHAVVVFVLALVACGNSSGDDDQPPGPECTETGVTCVEDTECCTGNCDDTTGTCTRLTGVCNMAGDACGAGPDCCSFACVDFVCSGNQCVSDGEACGVSGECCSGLCGDNGLCTPLNPSCSTSGNACTANGECCSGLCDGNLCSNGVSFCVQTGDACSTDVECCGGTCAISQGASLGTCQQVPAGGATGCTVAGELCDAGADYEGGPLPTCGGECCSRACFPYGASGALVCQPPSGCKPTGELCREDADCCGGPGQPDSESNVRCQKEPGFDVGRCDNGNSCSPAGAICRLQDLECNANANCCAGNVLQFDTCAQDNLGIPRCLQAEVDCTANPPAPGTPCATSADCCGLPCVPVPGSEFELVCGAACQPEGFTCTNNADCCAGLPCVDGFCGMDQGCSETGQACETAADCCNEQPCNEQGFCGTIIF